MKEELKQDEWENFKRQAEANPPSNKKGGIFGMFSKNNDLILKTSFELKRRYKEQLHMIDLTKLLRAKILNIKADEDMSESEIQLVKDLIQPYLIGM